MTSAGSFMIGGRRLFRVHHSNRGNTASFNDPGEDGHLILQSVSYEIAYLELVSEQW